MLPPTSVIFRCGSKIEDSRVTDGDAARAERVRRAQDPVAKGERGVGELGLMLACKRELLWNGLHVIVGSWATETRRQREIRKCVVCGIVAFMKKEGRLLRALSLGHSLTRSLISLNKHYLP